MTKNIKILVTDPIHPDAITRLTEEGFEVVELPEEKRSGLAKVVAPYNAIICRTSTVIDTAVFDAAKNLSCIAIASTGFDRIDMNESSKRGIAVMGLPSYNPDIDPERDGNFVSTAEHAVLLILAALGDFSHAYQSMKEGRWEKKHLVGNELASKTVGLLGFGRIAGLVARRLSGFRTRVIAYDPYASEAKARDYGVELVSLEEFLNQSDIISIHAPRTAETNKMLGKREFSLMKDGVFIINTARAAIMDEPVFIEALKSGKVKRAALDVFHDEPDHLNWDLIKMPNVIATPHIGGSTHEAWRRISLNAADNVIAFFRGKEVRNVLPSAHRKAVILAAGQGTRLLPLTETTPKPLLEIAGKALLDHQIEALIAAGIQELVIVVGYQKHLIEEHLARKNYPLSITYVHNDDYKTTGPILGGLVPAQGHMQGPVIFMHCDVLFTPEAIERLLAHPHDSVKLYRKGVWDEEAGKIIVDTSTGRVRELGKHIDKERATGEYLQIAKFGQDFVNHLANIVKDREKTGRDGYTIDAFNDVVQDESVTVLGLPYEGKIMEIDTPEDYKTAQETWEKK